VVGYVRLSAKNGILNEITVLGMTLNYPTVGVLKGSNNKERGVKNHIIYPKNNHFFAPINYNDENDMNEERR